MKRRPLSQVHLNEATGCWEWTGPKNGEGYGVIYALAHRSYYERYVGRIGQGLVIDHLCRNRACVNPEHLEPVTQSENIRRGNSWSAQANRSGHCLRGHPFSAENTYLRAGKRHCRACKRETRPSRSQGAIA